MKKVILIFGKRKYLKMGKGLCLGLWCLTPLSTIFQLYKKYIKIGEIFFWNS
jgi:hypothetical protein